MKKLRGVGLPLLTLLTLLYSVTTSASIGSYAQAKVSQAPTVPTYQLAGKKRARGAHCLDCPCPGRQMASFVGDLVSDAFTIHKNLFSIESFKIFVSFFPFFIAARMVDEKLQRCFYEEDHHKNRNQLPDWCQEAAKFSIALPIVALGSNAFFSHNEELRLTSRVFLIGMPFVVFGKDLIKKLEFDMCLRPWNQHFSCEKRSHGGFPSGHMAEAMYMAVLYGMRFGYKFAVPLGLIAGFVGLTFVTCNRHYVSQLVAGAGFGTMYAFAANRLVESKLHDTVTCGLSVDCTGQTTVSVSCKF